MKATPLDLQRRPAAYHPDVSVRGSVGTMLLLAALLAAATWPVAVPAMTALVLLVLAARRRRWPPSSIRPEPRGTRRDVSRASRVDPR